MYQVKRRGGAGHQYIDLTEAEQLLDDHLLTEDLREAVAAGDLWGGCCTEHPVTGFELQQANA